MKLLLPKLLLTVLCLFLTSPVFAANKIAVLYPSGKSFQNVYEKILEGISDHLDHEIVPLTLDKDTDPALLENEINTQKFDGLIALGGQAYLAARNLDLELPVVAGAMSTIPPGPPGISLSTSPEKMLSTLKSLAPGIRRVSLVYSAARSSWLIPLAKKAANELNLELELYETKSIRETMHEYREILWKARPNRDAIWLPLDRVAVNDEVVLPMLLQEAWDKNLVLFSNNLGHAKRGVLFSLYPDNYGLGKELAALLKSHSETDSQVKPTEEVFLAVNTRTAAHLNLNINDDQKQTFTVTFPGE